MDDRECEETYEKLLEVIRRLGLEWIGEQVRQEVRLGKTVEREVETLRDGRQVTNLNEPTNHAFPPILRKGPKARFPVTDAYSAPERVRLLVNALEKAVVDTAEMELAVFEHLSVSFHTEGILFAGDEGATSRLIGDSSTQRAQASRRLRELLRTLRSEI